MTSLTGGWRDPLMGATAVIVLVVGAARAQETRAFDVPPGPLAQVLNGVADAAGLTLVYDGATAAGLRSAGLSGTFSADDALTRLLAGTDLAWRRTEGGAVTVYREAAVDEGGGALALETITVRGELRSRDLQRTTTSAAVIDGAELERRDDRDLYTVIERTPGVAASSGDRGFVVRGVDQRGPGAAGSGLLVNTTVDGVTLPNNEATFFGPYSLWDLEQVEILRGPQSTQQGRNALAGAIIIRSADPTYAFEAKGRGEIGERDTFGGSVAINIPVVEDKVALRFSADHRRTDGFVTNPTLGDDAFDRRELTTLRAKARFDPTDSLSAVLSASYAENRGGEDFVERSLFPGQRINFSNVRSEEGSEHAIFGLRIDYAFAPTLRLESETNYYFTDYKRIDDVDQTALDGGLINAENDARSVEQEIRLLFERGPWSGVVGGFYTDIADDLDSGLTVPGRTINPALPDGVLITSDLALETDTRNFALFGEAEYRILPRLGLIAGLRYDREAKDFSSTTATASNVPLPLPPDGTTVSDTTFDAFLPKFGIVYDWTPDLSTGLTAQRGYRAGGTQQNPLTGAINEFDPEFTWTYEASLRSQWFDRRLTVNANAFYTQWEDQQVRVLGDTGLGADFNIVNAGESTLWGGEIDIRARPAPQIEAFVGLAFVRTEFTEFEDGGVDLSGNEFPFAPEFTASFGASYFFENGFEVHGDASFTDSSFSDAGNDPRAANDSRFLVNLRAGYQAEHWGLFAYARNLFDVDYVTQGSLATTPGSGGLARTGEPLTIGAYATVNF